MIRSLLRVGGAIALAALVAPGTPTAAPAPGIAYDEIVRVLVSATPPPPGGFQSDLAAINDATIAATPTPEPRKRGIGLGQIASAVIGGGGVGGIGSSVAGDVAANAVDNAVQQSLGTQFASLGASIRGFLQPHLMHYAYYNGWERVEDTVTQTATIRKCDIGQVVYLDLAKKTYTVYDPNSEPAPAAAPVAASRRSRGPAAATAPAPPGTAIADISATTRALGTQRIENIPAAGYESIASFATTQSTGSCRDGGASIRTTEYLSAMNRPTVTSCPVRRAPVPETANDVVTPPENQTGGCRPTLTFHHSGPPVPADKLSLYTLVSMNGHAGATPAPAPSGQPGGIGFLTERGNVRTVGATSVALFSIPADFVKSASP
jgi:hypothetical protein